MAYSVTPEQYARLQDAGNGWPDRLIKLGWFRTTKDGTETCAVGYLASRIGFREVNNISLMRETVSAAYGIPVGVLKSWEITNDGRHFFSTKRGRAKAMKRAFEAFVRGTTVMTAATARMQEAYS